MKKRLTLNTVAESLCAFPPKGGDTLGAGRPFLGVPRIGPG